MTDTMDDAERDSVAMLLAMDGSGQPTDEPGTINENGTIFVGDEAADVNTEGDQDGESTEHLLTNDEESSMVVGPDGSLPEGVLAVNQEGFIVACQEDNTAEGLLEASEGDIDMMDASVDPQTNNDATDETQTTEAEQEDEPMEIPDDHVSTSEDFSGNQFISQTSALVVQNEPPQQLMEEADTPGEVPSTEDDAETGEIDEVGNTSIAVNDEAFFTFVEEKSGEALQESNLTTNEEGDMHEEPVESLSSVQESDDVSEHINQADTPLEDSEPTVDGLTTENASENDGAPMELPLEGDTGASDGVEGLTLLAGGDHLKGLGNIVVNEDGTIHLLTDQESLQGIQLMEGDEKPEEEANGEEAAAQLQQDIQAQLREALMKQEEVKQEEEEKLPEPDPTPEAQPSAESDALATLASAALDHQAPSNGIKNEPDVPEVKAEQDTTGPQWMDVGICKGTHCVVRTFYTPSEGQSWDKNWENINTTTLPDHRALAKLELEAGKAYKFRVAAINSCGRGPWSEISAFRTSMPGVPGAPSAIKISKTVEGAHLSWEPPSAASGVIEDYTVYMAVRSATTDSQVVSSGANQLAFVRIYQGAENQCSVGFETLNEAHIDTTTKPAILFRIAARNEKGLGPAIQVRWLQDGAAPNSAKPNSAPRRVGGDLKPHANIKRIKSECE